MFQKKYKATKNLPLIRAWLLWGSFFASLSRSTLGHVLLLLFFVETEGRQVDAKAHEAFDHLSSTREEISQPEIESLSFPSNLGIPPPSSNILGSSRS